MFRFLYWLRRKTPSTFKPVVLITGCSSGIGLALAEILSNEIGYRVVVTARDCEPLRAKFSQTDRFWIRPLDVTLEKDRSELISEVVQAWGGINILINNAGISFRSVTEHMTEEDELLQLKTNYLGPVGLIRLVLPYMRETGRGKIINISSVSGMLAMPTMASYSASKYALEGVSEALWYELKPFGIRISLIQPGFINSESFKKVYYAQQAKESMMDNGPYHDFYKHMNPFIERLMGLSPSTPKKIARRILRVIRTENPPLWIPATIDAWIFYYIRRWLPRRWLHPILFAALPGARHWGSLHTHRRK